MKLGPKGTGVTKTESVTAKREWNFPREFLLKRLGLPEDARLYVLAAGDDGLTIDVAGEARLVAEATEVRRPKKEGNS